MKEIKNVEKVVYREEDYIVDEKVYTVKRYYIVTKDGVLVPIQVPKELRNELKGEEE